MSEKQNYYQKNRENILQKKKIYRENKRDKLNAKDKAYYTKNKHKILSTVTCEHCGNTMVKASLNRHMKKNCSILKENN